MKYRSEGYDLSYLARWQRLILFVSLVMFLFVYSPLGHLNKPHLFRWWRFILFVYSPLVPLNEPLGAGGPFHGDFLCFLI
jgi:hypothetical protein